MGRFASADSIVPGGVQGLDRYAYTANNPVNYTDPSGHVYCGQGIQCGAGGTEGGSEASGGGGSDWIVPFLKDRYNWDVADDLSDDELKIIRQTAYDIESYVDGLTGNMGQEWMNEYLGGITINHWSGSYNRTLPGIWSGTGQITISLVKGGFNAQVFAHELGHAWDINSGNYLGIGGGVGDDLMWAV